MDEIFYLVRHGGGGFKYWDCYTMPIQIRKYNVQKLSAEIDQENKAVEEARKKSSGDMSMQGMAVGDASAFKKSKDKKPDYIAKTSRK
jgi:hypothetical protein